MCYHDVASLCGASCLFLVAYDHFDPVITGYGVSRARDRGYWMTNDDPKERVPGAPPPEPEPVQDDPLPVIVTKKVETPPPPPPPADDEPPPPPPPKPKPKAAKPPRNALLPVVAHCVDLAMQCFMSH